MKFKTEENYCEIQNALYDYDSVLMNGVLVSKKLCVWINSHIDLHETCVRDRYFNSCFSGFPCEHTEENMEYHFSMFYYRNKDIYKWFHLNEISDAYIKRLLETTPGSDTELGFIDELYDVFGLSLSEIGSLDWNESEKTVDVELEQFNYGTIQIPKVELVQIRRLALEYCKIYE